MSSRLRTFGPAFFVLLLLTAGRAGGAADDDLSRPLILVAKPGLAHPLYSRSVIVVKPFGRAQHIGFIVNRPTTSTLASAFPEHGPSQKIAEPVYVGGPVDAQRLFALVERKDTPGGEAFELAPGLFAVFDAPTVDRIIESGAKGTRFVAGLVVWRPDELRAEVEQGAWHVRDANPQVIAREPRGLWEELAGEAGREEELQARSVRTVARR